MATATEIAALIAYVGGRTTTDDTFAGEKYDEAERLVARYIGDYRPHVPDAVYDQAVLEVGAKLWARKSAPNGSYQYIEDGVAISVPKDPMVTAGPILDRFLPGGFA